MGNKGNSASVAVYYQYFSFIYFNLRERHFILYNYEAQIKNAQASMWMPAPTAMTH